MKRTILAAVLALFGLVTLGAATASATRPDPEHKVWVCHANSGEGELKNGYNLIEVDVASTQYEAHQAHATTDPKVNKTYGSPPDYYLYDIIDVNPGDKCGGPGTTTTTTTEPEETTTTVAETTTTVVTTTAPATTAPPETTQPPVTTAPPTTAPPVVTTAPPPPPPPPPAQPTLPSTGAENWIMAAIGAALLASGSGLILATRRR